MRLMRKINIAKNTNIHTYLAANQQEMEKKVEPKKTKKLIAQLRKTGSNSDLY